MVLRKARGATFVLAAFVVRRRSAPMAIALLDAVGVGRPLTQFAWADRSLVALHWAAGKMTKDSHRIHQNQHNVYAAWFLLLRRKENSSKFP